MFPSYIRVQSVDWMSDQNVVSSESRNLVTLTRTLSGHRWSGRFRVQVRPWEVRQARAWLYGLQRDGATATYADPDWETSVTGVTANQASAGADTFQVNDSSELEPGMMFNFAGHDKLYMVIAAGAGSVEVFPALHADVANGESLVLDQPEATMELPPELKQSAMVAAQLERDPSSINLRMIEVRR